MKPPTATHPLPQPAGVGRNAAEDFAEGTLLLEVLRPRNWSRLRAWVEIVALCLASAGALLAFTPVRDDGSNPWISIGFAFLVLALLHVRESPDSRLFASVLDTVGHVLGIVSLSAMLIIAITSILGAGHPVALALRLWLFAFVYVAVARTLLLSLRRRLTRHPAFATPTLIVGAGLVGERLVERLLAEPRYGLRPVGFVDANPLSSDRAPGVSAVPVVGALEDLDQAVMGTGARHVILAFSSEPDHILVEKVKECQQLGIEVSLVPRLYEAINERATLDHISGLPLVSLRPTDPRGWQFTVKHAIDRGVSLLALMLLTPLMLAVAAGVKVSSPGPVLFRQRRVGRDGRTFDVLKFRTMRQVSDPHIFELLDGCAPGGVEGIDRRTPLGRRLRQTSVDELPQLINVLRGDMSLVGPRPERPEFVALFSSEVDRYQDRQRVKSGITGWAQVNGLRGQTSIKGRVEWDNYYIQNWSLRLDLRIIALTIAEIFRFRG